MADHSDSLTLDGQIIDAARAGDVARLTALLDTFPDKLYVKVPPYEASLLFPAAQSGNVEAVGALLDRGQRLREAQELRFDFSFEGA